MHIALVTHHYAPEVGAPQRRWGALVPRFLAAGHQVTVLAPSPHYPAGYAEALSPDLRPGATGIGEHGEVIHRLRFREHGPGLLSRTMDQSVTATDAVTRGLRELGRRGRRPDVVIATVPGMPSIGAGVALRRALRVPLVVEMRDAWPDLIEPAGVIDGARRRKGWRARVTTEAHRAMTYLQRDAAAVVTTTEAFGEVLRSRRMQHVEVIRNGAYLEEIPHLGQRQGDGGPLRVLYLGTVGRAQGLGTAVRASALLRERGVPIELRIVGPGVEGDDLRSLATSLGAPAEVTGAVPRSEVFDHYAWADSLLVSLRAWAPLEWTVPSKLYEALATGRHVTGVMAGESAELVHGTRSGHVVPPEDPEALATLWADLAADRTRLVVNPLGRLWSIEHADYDKLAARYVRLLHEVVL